MDVYYHLPADLPKHQPTSLIANSAKIVATWPIGIFIENIIVRQNGDIVICVHSENRLEIIGLDGSHSIFAQMSAPPTSMIEYENDLLVLGGDIGKSPGYLNRIADDGQITVVAEIQEALFLNGSSPFLPDSVLAVDSLLGTIFKIDLHTGQAATWFSHPLLTKITDFPLMPGGNGLRIFNRFVYVSNTDRAIVVRIPIQFDGTAGPLETVAEGLRADDFVFDTKGFCYLTTHIENTLVRLSPDGERVAIAGAEQGMAGSTAVRFGRTPETQNKLFVTTTGGLIGPYQGVAQEAKLVMVDVDATGYPVDFLEETL